MGVPTPLARMGRSGFEATKGGDALRSAKSMGMKTAPVAMSMASWRKAHKGGLIAGGSGVQNFSRRGEIAKLGGSASIPLVVDLRDFEKLGRSFTGIGVRIRQGDQIISRAINDGLRSLKTGVRRKLKAWTGIKSYAETARGMTMTHSTPATLTGTLRIVDRHRRLGPNFGAKWSRANPGGTHSAWNRSQLAAGSFMAEGLEPILVKRTGEKYRNARGQLKDAFAPLWGPNMAREVTRHRAEVERDVVMVVKAKVIVSAERMMRAAIAKAVLK